MRILDRTERATVVGGLFSLGLIDYNLPNERAYPFWPGTDLRLPVLPPPGYIPGPGISMPVYALGGPSHNRRSRY